MHISSRGVCAGMCILLTVAGCGRKKRNFFYSDDPIPLAHERIAPLSLPAVTGGESAHQSDGNCITWQPVSPTQLAPHTTVIGYHIYRFTHHSFIPKTPLTKKPITQPYYVDSDAAGHYHYVIRAVFSHFDQTISGPLSQVIVTHKK